MKPTMLDIAKACGVSKTLVSRIVNKDSTLKIPNETREKVLQEIERQHYIPNFNARILNNKLHNMESQFKLGYAVYSENDASGHPYFSHVFCGAIDEATRQKCVIVPVIMQYIDKNFIVTCPDDLDGLLIPTFIKNEKLKQIISSKFQYIVSMDGEFNAKSDIVETSICRSLRMGLNHLYSLGYREFGLLSGGIQERIDDFFDFAQKNDIVVLSHFVLDCSHNSTVAYQKMKEALKTSKPPRAILCHNDEMAIGCIQALIESGYRIPEDVAIVGHDDIDISAFTQVPLTTIRVYKEEIGRLAVLVLLERLRNKRKVPVHVDIPSKLIKRQSCGAKK